MRQSNADEIVEMAADAPLDAVWSAPMQLLASFKTWRMDIASHRQDGFFFLIGLFLYAYLYFLFFRFAFIEYVAFSLQSCN